MRIIENIIDGQIRASLVVLPVESDPIRRIGILLVPPVTAKNERVILVGHQNREPRIEISTTDAKNSGVPRPELSGI
jgi:hypothetical protein